jgi:hypothetical protein
MRFSSAVDAFHILPPAASSYAAYSAALLSIAQHHKATLFIPVSGAGSSVEDARAADEMFKQTGGRCRTFIQDPETMLDLHDKDRFMALVEKLGFATPKGQMVKSVDEAMAFLEKDRAEGPKYILKCMGLDENRGDMTLYPIKRGREEKRTAEQDGDERRGRVDMTETRRRLEGLKLAITDKCPYVFQEFIPGQGECGRACKHITMFFHPQHPPPSIFYLPFSSLSLHHEAMQVLSSLQPHLAPSWLLVRARCLPQSTAPTPQSSTASSPPS